MARHISQARRRWITLDELRAMTQQDPEREIKLHFADFPHDHGTQGQNMSSNLIERLRYKYADILHREAADRIEELEAENERLTIDRIETDGDYVIVTWKDGTTSRVLAK